MTVYGWSLSVADVRKVEHVCQVESLMVERDELVNHSHELESTVTQLKAKDGQLYYCSIE